MTNQILFEACVDSFESALTAQNAGAARIELCSDLLSGGITPSSGLIKQTVNNLKIPVNVLIRPRSGDFCYNKYEFDTIIHDIRHCREMKVSGIVIGILNQNGSVDKNRNKELLNIARPLTVTFHRAFDLTRNPIEALDLLIEIGFERLLTSGHEQNAEMGINSIAELVRHSMDRIIIMPGGGVNENNIRKIVSHTGVKEIHASAREQIKNKPVFNNSKVNLIDSKIMRGHETLVTSHEKIKRMLEALT